MAKPKDKNPPHPTSGLPPLTDRPATSVGVHRHQDRGDSEGGDGDVLGNDLLFGAEAIAAFLKRSPRWIYYQQANLGLKHIGATLVGSKSRLRALFSTSEKTEAA
jgi:hypothetical protein